MQNVFNKLVSAVKSIYLIPFSFYFMYQVHVLSKRHNIPFMHFLADDNWLRNYLEQNIKKGYEISTGVWLLIYIAYIIF
jgi:hypothetical protein